MPYAVEVHSVPSGGGHLRCSIPHSKHRFLDETRSASCLVEKSHALAVQREIFGNARIDDTPTILATNYLKLVLENVFSSQRVKESRPFRICFTQKVLSLS